MHHMLLYACHGDSAAHSKRLYDSYSSGNFKTACHTERMPESWQRCSYGMTIAWALGSDGATFPDDVGLPMSERFGGADYFLLEIHYDNPGLDKNVFDTSSGFRIYYSDRVRRHDAGLLLLGSPYGLELHIPPGRERYVTQARCTNACTRPGLPRSGVNVAFALLHSHLVATKMRVRHIRNVNLQIARVANLMKTTTVNYFHRMWRKLH